MWHDHVLRALGFLLLCLASTPAWGELSISPPGPTNVQRITLRLGNTVGYAAAIESHSIAREGNVFTMTQTVGGSCSLPTSTTVESPFTIGPLPSGEYGFKAITRFNLTVECDEQPTIIETATFTVLPDPSIPTPVLVPLLYNGAGSFGSTWWTRVVVDNHAEAAFGSEGVRFHTVDCPIPEGCSSATVPAGGYGEIETPQAPLGLILYAPRASAASVAFQARFGLGDGSDVSTSSELPVARESQFVQTPVRFPRVLLHAGSAPVRTTLRMYGIDAKQDTRVRVELRRWHEPSATPVATREIALSVAASDTTKPLYPAAAQLLLQQEFPFESLNGSEFAITVVPLPLPSGELPRIWAFLSITENATQDVLIQQPQ